MNDSLLPLSLASGYAKFRQFKYARHAQRYMELAVKNQKPETMVIACCDSRAAPETIFDASAGELFVVRNVANLVPPYAPDGQRHSTSAALEYGVHQLGVRNVVVMGHSRCGGVAAAINDTQLASSDFIGKWMGDMKDIMAQVPRASCDSDHAHSTAVEQKSIVESLKNLRSFPWVSALEAKGELRILGAWFDVALGELFVLNQANQLWELVPNHEQAA